MTTLLISLSQYYSTHLLVDIYVWIYLSCVDLVLFSVTPLYVMIELLVRGQPFIVSWRDLTSHRLMIILFCDSSHAIYSLTRWLYVYIILGSAFLRISGQLAFGVQLDVLGFVRRRSKASRRLRMRLFIFRCTISCVYQQFVRTGCYNCPVLRVVLVMYL